MGVWLPIRAPGSPWGPHLHLKLDDAAMAWRDNPLTPSRAPAEAAHGTSTAAPTLAHARGGGRGARIRGGSGRGGGLKRGKGGTRGRARGHGRGAAV